MPAIIGVLKMPGAIAGDADAELREFAGGGENERADAALRRRVSRLADLAFKRRDRRRHDDDAAFAGFERGLVLQIGGEQAGDVERTHEVDVDDPLEMRERHRAIF